MSARYAWIITKDHIPNPEAPEGSYQNARGLTGPADAPHELLENLAAGQGDTFRMYDDDQEIYYTGRGLSVDDEWDDNACFGPVYDFGRPNAGAIWIRWQGHPERDNG